jgi:hypothetical protein
MEKGFSCPFETPHSIDTELMGQPTAIILRAPIIFNASGVARAPFFFFLSSVNSPAYPMGEGHGSVATFIQQHIMYNTRAYLHIIQQHNG